MNTIDEKNKHAIENAAAHLETLTEAFTRIDALNDGGDLIEFTSESDIQADWDQEQIEEYLRESALSVLVRSDWHEVDGDASAAEFEILLTTGGPALRVRGDLDLYGEPSRAYMEFQDWGTPWTLYHESGIGETLLRFAQLFYYGEGA